MHVLVLALTPFFCTASDTDCYLKFLPRAILLWNSLYPNIIKLISDRQTTLEI